MSNFLFLGTSADVPFLPRLKPMMKGHTTFVDCKPIRTLAEVDMYCKGSNRNITGVLSTSLTLLQKLTNREKVSIDNYAGSYFRHRDIEYVFLPPLEQSVTVPYGDFLIERFVSKLVTPANWIKTSEFKWRVLDGSNYAHSFDYLSNCELIACDIETFRLNLSIRCIGFTGVKFVNSSIQTHSFVLPLTSEWAIYCARQICGLPAGKIFQNGKYDLSYLARYSILVYNYLWDTAALFHAWYSELPKDLGFLQAFFVREAAYWKDLADTQDLEQYYLYNAKDTWATAFVLLAWMKEAPVWARKNYLLEFPLQFPCHMSEMIGIARDGERLIEARAQLDVKIAEKNKLLQQVTGQPTFNSNSPKQVKSLLKTLGCGDLPSSDDKSLAKAAFRHPLNNYIVNIIRGTPKSDNPETMGIRAMRKAKSTYLRTDDDAKNPDADDGDIEGGSKDFKGRLLYALNPHGTDSGRLASKAHHFWCGFNIQNQPVGSLIKQTYIADDGFLFGESDLEQAETRDTAYITGDTALLKAISSDNDFHSTNTAAFFGVQYESVYDNLTRKVKNKPLRNVAKRVNHGANYNMGPDVLVDTMGLIAIFEAARLLKLPRHWDARDVAKYLLEQFDKTYPTIRGDYHAWVISQILTHKRLVGATGWTRYCFSNPKTSKTSLNSYVAHSPQSLNAMVLNQAYMIVFYTIAMHPDHRDNFKLCAQIHDSILFQYRAGHEYLGEMVRKAMEIAVDVKDIRGVTRTLTVPAALKLGGKYWSELE